jgi:hypothetical protein
MILIDVDRFVNREMPRARRVCDFFADGFRQEGETLATV